MNTSSIFLDIFVCPIYRGAKLPPLYIVFGVDSYRAVKVLE